jgi:hypothetical protein
MGALRNDLMFISGGGLYLIENLIENRKKYQQQLLMHNNISTDDEQ